jgi:Fe-S oxidoreductase
MAKLKSEFLHMYYEGRPRPLGEVLLARIHRLNQFGALAAPAVNWLQERRVFRWLMEKVAGIDRRRSLPALHAQHFRRWFARHQPAPSAGRSGRVLLLDDCFTTFNEPQIGQAAVSVLEHAGYKVELAGLTCCGRAMISKGFLHQARELIRVQVGKLARRMADGTPLLGLEPSCLLTLADEWTELLPGKATQAVAAAAELADSFLARQVSEGRCHLPLSPGAETCLLHGHCHQKALRGVSGTVAALRLVPGLEPTVLDAGCCGMAGSFGYEVEHYEVSRLVGERRLFPAVRGAEAQTVIVAPGLSCRLQVAHFTDRTADHPAMLLRGLVETR